MKFHMLMFMNEWVMLMLMQMQVQSASLTQGCYRRVLNYRVIKVIFANSYMMVMLQVDSLPRAINQRYVKKYFLSVWQEAQNAFQIMADICIVLRTNMVDIYITLRCQIADELGIIAIQCFNCVFMFMFHSPKNRGTYVDTKKYLSMEHGHHQQVLSIRDTLEINWRIKQQEKQAKQKETTSGLLESAWSARQIVLAS